MPPGKAQIGTPQRRDTELPANLFAEGFVISPSFSGLLVVASLGLATAAWGAQLTDADLAAGRQPAVGDTVILSDFGACYPRSACAPTSTRGKWWLRGYTTASGQAGRMLCVEERDKEHPETCLAPALTYPLKLAGVYDIWVGTYRPRYGGGVDIKLTADKVFGSIDPWQKELRQWPPPEADVGRLVEVFFKTAELSGQSLHLRQPDQTYQSL